MNAATENLFASIERSVRIIDRQKNSVCNQTEFFPLLKKKDIA